MDWKVFLEQAPSGGMTYLGWLGSGLLWTLLVSTCAWVIAFSLGSVIGVLRTTPLKVPRAIATTYVEVFRNVPLLRSSAELQRPICNTTPAAPCPSCP